jgi:two-component system response regulator HydG
MNKLVDYSWPGNVRELENAIERAVVLSRSDTLQNSDLPEAVSQSDATSIEALTFPIGTPLDEVEHRLIRETMKYTSGDKALAAQLLGISTRTIYRKLGDAEGGNRGEPE